MFSSFSYYFEWCGMAWHGMAWRVSFSYSFILLVAWRGMVIEFFIQFYTFSGMTWHGVAWHGELVFHTVLYF